MHWARRRLYNRRWLDELMVSKNRIKLFGRPEHRDVNVTIQVNYYKRPMDEDNLYASVKPVLDGLVKLGILKDDNPEVIKKLSVNQVKTTRQFAGTAIAIQSVTLAELII